MKIKTESDLYYTEFTTPIGTLGIRASDRGLTGIFMEEQRHASEPSERARWSRTDASLVSARAQFEEYFAGKRTTFDLPLDLHGVGGTEFQRRVWAALTEIPYGETISYGELARRIGQPTAVRAVGLANGRNPLPIIVPCHRVIGANGSLTGFGGGIDRKRALLDLEARASGRVLV
jgi:methylated-DNA-[protein]-cysteine S-methyltransferase